MKAPIYAPILLAGCSLGLAACSQETAEPLEAEAPEGVAGLTVTNARLMLPPVSGNPAAVYFDLAYSGDKTIAIYRADVAGAGSAELHETVEVDGKMTMGPGLQVRVAKGDEVKFEPGGRHVMAFDLSDDLMAGGTTEVTLTIAGGDKHSFEVPIKAAGDER